MKRILAICLIVLMYLGTGYSQFFDDEPVERKERSNKLFFGGNFGLQFGTVTFIELSPTIGFRATERIAIATGPIYEYYSDKRFTPDLKTDIYGGRLYSRYYLIPNLEDVLNNFMYGSIFLHTEYEGLSLEHKYFGSNPGTETGRFWLSSVLIGGGLSQRIGERSSINLAILWNLNETADSPYSNPILRIGFNF